MIFIVDMVGVASSTSFGAGKIADLIRAAKSEKILAFRLAGTTPKLQAIATATI
jgi:hypothetical protein